jgi:putative ABC transport system permease protein
MHVLESARIGLREIAQHKLRSALTMLGVIFGVAAVISTSAIGAGARAELDRQLEELGANTIRAVKVELKGGERQAALRLSPWGLTRADASALAQAIPGVIHAAPLKKFDAQLASDGRTIPAEIVGTDSSLDDIVGYRLDAGRFLAETDVEEARPVCVIGDAVRLRAFPLSDPVGQRLLIDGIPFTVVGQLAPRVRRGSGAVVESLEIDRVVFIPISSGIRRVARTDPRAEDLDQIILKASSSETLRESAALAERVLLRRHNGAGDFKVIVPEELVRQQQKTKDILSSVLLFIAAISLLVGGIGIMNIMLASVTQRTREIGIRRALGATRDDILGQFLTETVIVSLCGGVAGIAVGFGLAEGIARFAGWTTIVPLEAVAVSVSVAAGVGFLFGFYPSLKAAQLDPIEALRVE